MNRALVERIYAGEAARPTVETAKLQDENFIFAATPWGNKDSFKELTAAYGEILGAAAADREATTPFARLSNLSPLCNSLRAATMYANEKTFKKCNQDVYSSACEGVAIAFEANEVAWVRVGQPHVMLVRDGKLVPLDVAVDLGVDYAMSAPLPSKLIGTDAQMDFEVRSLSLHESDRIVLMARSVLPGSLFGFSFEGKSSEEILDSLFHTAVADDDKMPFWAAVLG